MEPMLKNLTSKVLFTETIWCTLSTLIIIMAIVELSINKTIYLFAFFTEISTLTISKILIEQGNGHLALLALLLYVLFSFLLLLILTNGVKSVVDGKVLVKGAWCSIKREFVPYAFEISICVFFVIPMSIITALYVLIGLKLRKSRRRGPNRPNNELTVEPIRYATTSRNSQGHVIRMLVSVVVAFFVCWAPFHAQRLLAIYAQGTKSKTLIGIYDMLTHASGILYFLSTCINPVLYNIMSNKFRQAFKDTLSRLCRKRVSGGARRSYSLASNRSSRMGVNHNFGSRNNAHRLSQYQQHHDTCVNCRHIPSMCSCRGNSTKFIRNYTPPPQNAQNFTFTPGTPGAHEAQIPLNEIKEHSQGRAGGNRGVRLNVGMPPKSQPIKKGAKSYLFGLIKSSRPPHFEPLKKKEGGSSGIESEKTTGTCSSYYNNTTSSDSDSNNSNSISNSSLQDLDQNEYTGLELARYLAEMKK